MLADIACNAQSRLDLLLSTFVGGSGNNQPIGVGMINNKAYVAGNFTNLSFPASGVSTVNLMGATNASRGKILIVNADTRALETVINVCGVIYDFATAPNNNLEMAIAGDSGVLKISTQSFNLLWRTRLVDARMKITMNNEGTVAIIFSNNLMQLVTTSGQIKSGLGLPYTVINDIALIGNKAFVTGYNAEINEGNFCVDSIENYRGLQVAYLAAYTFSDTSYYPKLVHTTWGFEGTDMNCDIAYTAGVRLTVGQNGSLYFLGETVNSQNIFRWNGKTNWKLNGGYTPTPTYYEVDAYNSLANTGPAIPIAYLAQIDPNNGDVIRGQFILSRNASISSGPSNSPYIVRDGSIAADASGNVYIGGMAGESIANRNNSGIGGIAPSAFAGGDPAIYTTSNFYNRNIWQAATGAGGSGSLMALALSRDYLAGLVRVDKGRMITRNAFYPNPFNSSATDNSTDITLMIWIKQSLPTEITEGSLADDCLISPHSIVSNHFIGAAETSIFNLQGVNMPIYKTSENEIALEHYTAGIYVIKVVSPKQTMIKKFIIF